MCIAVFYYMLLSSLQDSFRLSFSISFTYFFNFESVSDLQSYWMPIDFQTESCEKWVIVISSMGGTLIWKGHLAGDGLKESSSSVMGRLI